MVGFTSLHQVTPPSLGLCFSLAYANRLIQQALKIRHQHGGIEDNYHTSANGHLNRMA